MTFGEWNSVLLKIWTSASKNGIDLSKYLSCSCWSQKARNQWKLRYLYCRHSKGRSTLKHFQFFNFNGLKIQIYRPEKTGGSRNSRNRFIFETGPSRVRPSKKSRNRPSRDRSDRSKSRRKMPRLRTGTAKIWVKKQDDKCGCPKLRPKQSYLILGNQRRIGRSKIIAAGGRTGR